MTGAQATHEVIRQISGMDLEAGDRVDASGWANLAKLEDQGYVKPLSDVDEVRKDLKKANARIAELEAELAKRPTAKESSATAPATAPKRAKTRGRKGASVARR
jgi:hypothetical protein